MAKRIDVDDMTEDQLMEAARGEEIEAEPEVDEKESEQSAEAEQQEDIGQEPDSDVETEQKDTADEGTEDAESAQDAEKSKSETVPHGQFHRERLRRQEAEREKAELIDRLRLMEERTNAVLAAMGQNRPGNQNDSAEQAGQIPDPGDDPVAAVARLVQRENEREARDAQARQQTEAQQRQAQELQATIDRAAREFQASAEDDPSIRDAYQYALDSFAKEYKGYGLTGAALQQQIAQTEQGYITYAAQNRIDVADLIRNIASARGWAAREAVQQASNGAQSSAVISEDAKAHAREASRSLGTSGGSVANTGAMTLQDLSSMSEKEFSAYLDKYGYDVVEKIMG